MNENNTQVITTTTNDNMITITLTYGQQQNAATEKPEITPEELDELAHEAGYLTKEEAEDLISEARQNALSDANEEEFECEANDRGYYTIEEALYNADDYDFNEEAEKRGYIGEEDLGSVIEEVRGEERESLEDRGWVGPESSEGVWETAANDRGYYRKDQIIDSADLDELIEAINSRLGSKLMTEEGWREQATEDGWQCPEQVAQTIADTIAELKNQIATLLQNEQLNYLQNA